MSPLTEHSIGNDVDAPLSIIVEDVRVASHQLRSVGSAILDSVGYGTGRGFVAMRDLRSMRGPCASRVTLRRRNVDECARSPRRPERVAGVASPGG